jgi:hypothetical protein
MGGPAAPCYANLKKMQNEANIKRGKEVADEF